MESRSRTHYITNAALIAATYVVVTALANALGLASGTIQIRISEALCVLVYFTHAAIPGLTIGCFLSNLLSGCVVFDIVFGTFATFIGATCGFVLRKYRYLVPVPTIASNAIIVPLILQLAYGIELPYLYLLATVGVGEIISAGIFGIVLMNVLIRIPYFRDTINTEKE